MENVGKELRCILKTGEYNFDLGLNFGTEVGFDGVKCELFLNYEAYSLLHPSQSSSDIKSLAAQTVGNIQQKEVYSQKLNSEQIKDFLRKLGFIDKEKKEEDTSIKDFLYLSQVNLIILHCSFNF